ncbi:MAG: Ig-like domain-containing protein [Terracidiphilus sp.]
MIRRSLRLELVAGLGIALAMPALSVAAVNTQHGVATQTTLNVETRDQGGRTQANVAVIVTGVDGLPASGAVVLSDRGTELAGAGLNAAGQASLTISLPAGDHSLSATYQGDSTHASSVSQPEDVHALDSSTPSFGISISPVTLTLTPGQTGTLMASVSPVNSGALTAPMFVTLSCSALPDQSSCTFTPENLEILPNAATPVTSTLVIITQAEFAASPARPRSNPVAWAFLLPGAFGLGGLAWGTRRRAWLNRLVLLALVALVTTLGATACSPRYDYYNHGPPIPPPTPAGTYTVLVTAQSSNGITAITQTADLGLTIK